MSGPTGSKSTSGLLGSIGPAIITASVVLGPGSILAASKIGADFGYAMVWVLALAVLLMIGMTALSARLGVVLDGTLCEELAGRAGRPIAVLTGFAVFLIVACFQFGNNQGVLAALEPFYEAGSSAGGVESKVVPILVIVNLNLVVVVALFGFRALYQPIERLMKFLVGLMMIGFAGNLIWARPDLVQLLAGLTPTMPQGAGETLLPSWQPEVIRDGERIQEARVVDNLVPVVAMFATTFSVAGAFYQSYLVRQKGWTRAEQRQGLVDSAVGITILGLLTLMIMVTAAVVLHDRSETAALQTAADVARQLEPAFGPAAKVLFCMGIFAGALSSFLVNAMIGGSMLSDGLGLGGYIDQRWPKLFTVLALAAGMNVSVYIYLAEISRPVELIIFAQAATVLGFPLLAAGMLWLATRRDLTEERRVPAWMKLAAALALLVTLALAVRKATSLLLSLWYT